ncbi:MAG TPA: roadblock/LC7 domain-containing protein [Syntrophales bacterium]|nr:roadblock/LC7 domain-containing protein [Syntrophales bacterium]
MNLALGGEQLDKIYDTMKSSLIEIGVETALLLDTAGNVITSVDDGSDRHDVYSLAALAAANFSAMRSMAKIAGEEEFSLLFHRGQKENIYLSAVSDDFLLFVIFNNEMPLGLLRLKVAKVIGELIGVLITNSSL